MREEIGAQDSLKNKSIGRLHDSSDIVLLAVILPVRGD